MVAMEAANVSGDVMLEGPEKHGDQQRQQAGGETLANAALGVKASSASEVSPQTAETVPNGNGNAHEHANGDHLGENGHEATMGEGALPQTGEYLTCGRLLAGAQRYEPVLLAG
jgi:hypothetical protein